MQISCDELARRGDKLIEGTAGEVGEGDVMALIRTDAGYRAIDRD